MGRRLRTEMAYQIVHAGTRRPVRMSNWSANTVVDGLYSFLFKYPEQDFLIVDGKGRPVPVSRLRP